VANFEALQLALTADAVAGVDFNLGSASNIPGRNQAFHHDSTSPNLRLFRIWFNRADSSDS
jgi:hypothetical protein